MSMSIAMVLDDFSLKDYLCIFLAKKGVPENLTPPTIIARCLDQNLEPQYIQHFATPTPCASLAWRLRRI
jgi:hypothetical protein